jgi:hypothetical protein
MWALILSAALLASASSGLAEPGQDELLAHVSENRAQEVEHFIEREQAFETHCFDASGKFLALIRDEQGNGLDCQREALALEALKERLSRYFDEIPPASPEISGCSSASTSLAAPENLALQSQQVAAKVSCHLSDDERLKREQTSCIQDFSCNLLRSTVSAVSLGTASYFASLLPSLKKAGGSCLALDRSDCFTEFMTGVLRDLVSNIELVWDGIRWVRGQVVEGWRSLWAVEDQTSEKLHAASQQGPGLVRKFLKDPVEAIQMMARSLWQMLLGSIRETFMCRKWEGPPHRSRCLEPMDDVLACATCDQSINAVCGVLGFAGGEVVTAYLTGGALQLSQAATKVGGVGLARAAARVSEAFPKTALVIESSVKSGAEIAHRGASLAFKALARLREAFFRAASRPAFLRGIAAAQAAVGTKLVKLPLQGAVLVSKPLVGYVKLLDRAFELGLSHGAYFTGLLSQSVPRVASLAGDGAKVAEVGALSSRAAGRLEAVAGKQTSEILLREDLAGVAGGSREAWIQEHLTPAFEQAAARMRDWTELSKSGLRRNERVFWIQQHEIKELNERLWNMGGTERYLSVLDDELARTLREQPALGRVVHQNYKDRVVVSALSESEFEQKVLIPTRQRAAERVAKSFSSQADTATDWQAWMAQSTDWGSGKSLLQAHLAKNAEIQLLQREHGVSVVRAYERWHEGAVKLRTRVDESLRGSGLNMREAFLLLKKAEGSVEGMVQLLARRGVDRMRGQELAKLVADYRQSLSVGDFLPLPKKLTPADARRLELASHGDYQQAHRLLRDSWVFERNLAFSKTPQAGMVVAIDVQGLGVEGLIARDDWLKRGAKLSELPQVYGQTTERLERRMEQMRKGIEEAIGGKKSVHLYQSGDDALILVPPNSHRAEIEEFISSQTGLYAHLEVIPPVSDAARRSEDVAGAIHRARTGVFDQKARGETSQALRRMGLRD